MVNDSKYVSHHVIHADLARVFKQKNIDIMDVMEWCAQVETRHIKDVDKMVLYLEVALTVDTDNHMALLPCNVWRILDVYEDVNGGQQLNHYNNGAYLILPDDYTEEYVYINFVGTAVAENGEPLIIKGHENACMTYCKIQIFEEDVAMGKMNAQIWSMWKDEFSGQMQNAKTDMRHFTREHFNKLQIIHGNMIQKIGQQSLYHRNFETDV